MSDTLTFKERYQQCKTWQEKAILISLYHSIMSKNYPTWNINDTAQHFGKSAGLVSENIRLAQAIDGPRGKKIMECKTREEGLKLIERRHYVRNRIEFILIKEDE